MSNTRSCFSNQAMFSLQEISDRLEIQQLLVDYSTAIDQRRFDDLDRVFTEDAYIDYRAPRERRAPWRAALVGNHG